MYRYNGDILCSTFLSFHSPTSLLLWMLLPLSQIYSIAWNETGPNEIERKIASKIGMHMQLSTSPHYPDIYPAHYLTKDES